MKKSSIRCSIGMGCVCIRTSLGIRPFCSQQDAILPSTSFRLEAISASVTVLSSVDMLSFVVMLVVDGNATGLTAKL